MYRSTILLLLGAAGHLVSAMPSATLVTRDEESFFSDCDMGLASMPIAPTPLPTPADGMKLYHVAVGRGTQNYTCATSDSSTTPAAIGAVATLFNASCVAATFPELLTIMPNISMRTSVPESDDKDSPINRLRSGHHYFTDNTTAYFNLNTEEHSWGGGALKKVANSTSPLGAKISVPWLKLVVKNASVETDSAWGEVYRINTAGGVAPKTCDGMPSHFEVDYSAEYWMYVNTTKSQ